MAEEAKIEEAETAQAQEGEADEQAQADAAPKVRKPFWQKWSLKRQAYCLLGLLSVVGFLTLAVVLPILEKHFLTVTIKRQMVPTMLAFVAASADAVISEDEMLMARITKSIMDSNNDIEAVRFYNEDHQIIYKEDRNSGASPDNIFGLNKEVVMEGEKFGEVRMRVNLAEHLKRANTHVWLVRLYMFIFLSCLVLAFLFTVTRWVLKPIALIRLRTHDLISGNKIKDLKFTISKELVEIGEDFKTLSLTRETYDQQIEQINAEKQELQEQVDTLKDEIVHMMNEGVVASNPSSLSSGAQDSATIMTGTQEPMTESVVPDGPRMTYAIDDEPSTRDLIQQQCESKGMTIECEEDCEIGMEYFRINSARLELLILPLVILEMMELTEETFHVVRDIRPDLPILFTTASLETMEIPAYLTSASHVGFIEKPLNAESLLAKIDELLSATTHVSEIADSEASSSVEAPQEEVREVAQEAVQSESIQEESISEAVPEVQASEELKVEKVDGPPCVVVIDDEEATCEQIKSQLAHTSLEIIIEQDVSELIQLYLANYHRIELMVLPFVILEMFEETESTYKAIREKREHLPLLYTIGTRETTDIPSYLESDRHVDCVEKPLVVDDFKQRVDQLLANKVPDEIAQSAQSSDSSSDSVSAPMVQASGPRRIFIVDDEEKVCQQLSEVFEGSERVLLIENDVDNLFTVYQEQYPNMDLIVLPFVILEMFEQTQSIFEEIRRTTPYMPILYTIGTRETTEIPEYLEKAEGVDFVEKPFNMDDLKDRAEKLLAQLKLPSSLFGSVETVHEAPEAFIEQSQTSLSEEPVEGSEMESIEEQPVVAGASEEDGKHEVSEISSEQYEDETSVLDQYGVSPEQIHPEYHELRDYQEGSDVSWSEVDSFDEKDLFSDETFKFEEDEFAFEEDQGVSFDSEEDWFEEKLDEDLLFENEVQESWENESFQSDENVEVKAGDGPCEEEALQKSVAPVQSEDEMVSEASLDQSDETDTEVKEVDLQSKPEPEIVYQVKGHKVLIIDDEDDVLDTIQDNLKHCGLEPITDNDVENILSIYEEHHEEIQLVIVPLVILEMLEMTEVIVERTRAINPQLPLIFTTGTLETTVIPESLQLVQKITYVEKPVEKQAFLEAIQMLLPHLTLSKETQSSTSSPQDAVTQA